MAKKSSKSGKTESPAQLYKAKKITRAEYDKRIGSTRASKVIGKGTGVRGRKPGKIGGKNNVCITEKGTGARNKMLRGLDIIEQNAVHDKAIAQDMKRVIGKKV